MLLKLIFDLSQESADTHLAALDMLGVGQFLAVGEGAPGANVCTWMAIKRPSQVSGLFLASPGRFIVNP